MVGTLPFQTELLELLSMADDMIYSGISTTGMIVVDHDVVVFAVLVCCVFVGMLCVVAFSEDLLEHATL